MSSPISSIFFCAHCKKQILSNKTIFKEIDSKIKFCSKKCFDERIMTHEEKSREVYEKRILRRYDGSADMLSDKEIELLKKSSSNTQEK